MIQRYQRNNISAGLSMIQKAAPMTASAAMAIPQAQQEETLVTPEWHGNHSVAAQMRPAFGLTTA